MTWYDNVIAMKPHGGLKAEDVDTMEDQYFIQLEDELFGKDWLDCFATKFSTQNMNGPMWQT